MVPVLASSRRGGTAGLAAPGYQSLSASGVTINNKSGLDAEHNVDLFRQLSWADQGAA
jgi:hypothetical protein